MNSDRRQSAHLVIYDYVGQCAIQNALIMCVYHIFFFFLFSHFFSFFYRPIAFVPRCAWNWKYCTYRLSWPFSDSHAYNLWAHRIEHQIDIITDSKTCRYRCLNWKRRRQLFKVDFCHIFFHICSERGTNERLWILFLLHFFRCREQDSVHTDYWHQRLQRKRSSMMSEIAYVEANELVALLCMYWVLSRSKTIGFKCSEHNWT